MSVTAAKGNGWVVDGAGDHAVGLAPLESGERERVGGDMCGEEGDCEESGNVHA